MNKFLITGATGFVGKALCDTLYRRGISFVPAVRHLERTGQFEIGNINSGTDWSDALTGCDTVIHLAARVHKMTDRDIDSLRANRETNVLATINLAKQAAELGIKRFVFVSSIKVNGEESNRRPFTPFDEPAPRESYGQSKLEAEIALHELSSATGLETVIVRPPIVYGPGVSANFLKLMRLVKMGVPLPFGAVHNRRSMVALDNLVDLLILCAGHPNAADQTFLVSDDHDISIPELLRMLERAMGKRSLLFPVPPKIIASAAKLLGKSATMNRLMGSLQVDISHTKFILGWQPVANMQESIDKTVEFFLKQH